MKQEIIPTSTISSELPTKQCSNKECKQIKPLSEFHTSKINSDRYQSWCKECQKKSYDKWYAKQKENKKGIIEKENADIPEGMKRCGSFDCRKIKPVEEFCKDNKRIDGLSNRCKECQRNRSREFRKLKKEKRQVTKNIVEPNLNILPLKKAMNKYNLPEEELRLCQKENKYKPLYMFRSSITSADGFTKNCIDCIFQIGIRDAVQQEILDNKLKNRVDVKNVILFPMMMDDFLNLHIINREEKPKKPLTEYECRGDYARDHKIKNDYILSGEDFYPEREYCEGEPASSFREFMITKPSINHREQQVILEDRGELAYATKEMRKKAS